MYSNSQKKKAKIDDNVAKKEAMIYQRKLEKEAALDRTGGICESRAK